MLTPSTLPHVVFVASTDSMFGRLTSNDDRLGCASNGATANSEKGAQVRVS